jgi:hypothetical protein
MMIPDWVQQVVQRYEKQTTPHNEVQIADAIRTARGQYGNLSDEDWKGFLAEDAVFLFHEHRDRNSVWGTYFGPMMTMTREDGKELRSPDIQDLDAEVVAHWELRTKEVKNPVMRARYADAVWDLKNAITGQRPSHEYAQVAIDSYLEAAEQGLYTIEIEGIQWVLRALDLSLSLKDKDRIKSVVDFMFRLYDRVAQARYIGTWVFLFDNLYDKDEWLTDEQQKRIVTTLEEMLAVTSNPENNEQFDPWGAQAAAQRLAQHYDRQKSKGDIQRVTKAYGESFEKMAKEASPMLAMAWLQPVIEKYHQSGLKDEAERLQLASEEKGKNIADDMKRIEVKLEIKREEIDSFVESLTNTDLPTSLVRIATHFIPSVDEAKKFLQDIRTKAPLKSLIPVVKVDSGRMSAKAGSVEDDPEGTPRHFLVSRICSFACLSTFCCKGLISREVHSR